MSRNPSKARADKSRATSAQPPPPTQPEEVENSVDLGPSLKSEFLTMIAHEEGEEIVSEIMDELMAHVMEKCYEVYLKKQIVPFTVTWVNNIILQLIKWQHLERDEGDDVNTALILEEDTEPIPTFPDSWSVGCLSIMKVTNYIQEVKPDMQNADITGLQNMQKTQPINKTESSPRKPRRNGRTTKPVPASSAKIESERKPRPPQRFSPNKLKPPEK
ncbi:uncharacterized protein C2orf81 homolog [Silurus meridionalis]|uniref:Uncharacterized protein n=1 Tax=Silurus meridionalis TaxID=175797 RepID=A0A8T0A8T5_SILME|nr:uncharacterized protein C2orf81 homolog [Silurus meridionalis]XP_046698162.1 uncharacterized protein C2orf81 homolog [Silurus meridionalis]KAF7687422.1 hypothetical protein HF521_014650 [Silurus meridionalis]